MWIISRVHECETEVLWTRGETRSRIRRKIDFGDGTTWSKKKTKIEAKYRCNVPTETWELSRQQNKTPITELAG